MDRSNVRCLQLRDANTELLRENEDGKARSEELPVKLDRLTETNQRYKTAYEESVTEQRAKTDSLTDKLKNTLVKLSKSEENYESSLANFIIETERLEDKIKELESQLTNSKKSIRQWAEAEELKRVNENYSIPQRLATIIYASDKTTISKFQKENGKIQEENEKLKQVIAKEDKQMTEIRFYRVATGQGKVGEI